MRAFRETLRKRATRPGFRVIHYSIQDDHAHFIVEAAGAKRLANGMKSLAARFARCVNAGGFAAGWCSPAVARCWPTASTTC